LHRGLIPAQIFQAARALEQEVDGIGRCSEASIDLGEMSLVAVLPGSNPHPTPTVA
jgi:hypothetical protein